MSAFAATVEQNKEGSINSHQREIATTKAGNVRFGRTAVQRARAARAAADDWLPPRGPPLPTALGTHSHLSTSVHSECTPKIATLLKRKIAPHTSCIAVTWASWLAYTLQGKIVHTRGFEVMKLQHLSVKFCLTVYSLLCSSAHRLGSAVWGWLSVAAVRSEWPIVPRGRRDFCSWRTCELGPVASIRLSLRKRCQVCSWRSTEKAPSSVQCPKCCHALTLTDRSSRVPRNIRRRNGIQVRLTVQMFLGLLIRVLN